MPAVLKKLMLVGFAIVGFALLTGCDPEPVLTFLVDSTADEVDDAPGDGVCATASATCTLRAAIEEANASPGVDEVVLQTGATYALSLAGAGEDGGTTGDLDVTDSLIISGNAATIDGGGLDRVFHVHGDILVIVKNTTVTGGVTAEDGAGLLNDGGAVVLRQSTFDDNHADDFGGGVANLNGTLRVDRSTVSNNTATWGAGITNQDTAFVSVSTVSGNDAASGGGGVAASSGTTTIEHSTIVNNSAALSAGGVRHYAGSVTLDHTIVADQTAGPNCAGVVTSLGFNVESDGSCSFTQPTDLFSPDPMLGALADNGGPTLTHLPDTASPVVDRDTSGCPSAYDQRGHAAPDDGNGDSIEGCDIGAVEVAAAGPGTFLVNTSTDTVDADPGDGVCADIIGFCSLRAAVQEANARNLGDTITAPAGLGASLTLAGSGEDAGTTGDLDITGTMTLQAVTIDAAGTDDRVLHVHPGGELTVAESTITGGGVTGNGGGIFNEGTATITGTTISGNTASSGGGVANEGSATFVNSTISGNDATGSGGGAFNDGTLSVLFTTIADNTAPTGAGIDTNGGAPGTTIEATIVAANNVGTDCDGTTITDGYNVDSDSSCLPVPATGDQAGADPLLGPLGDNGGTTHTHLPDEASPAVDLVDLGTSPCDGSISADQRGGSRPAGSGCDAGSVDVTGPLTTSLWSWGDDESGATGLAAGLRVTPAQVGADAGWAAVSNGNYHGLAVRDDGTLWAWGHNGYGRTGLGTAVGETLSPTQVGTATNWAMVSVGEIHSLALRTDGTLWAWGYNGNAATGLGTTVGNTLTPTQVGTATNWAAISAGERHSLALRTDGTLWAWGRNEYGQAGLGVVDFVLGPTQVGTATNWAEVSAGGEHSVAVRSDGTLWAWGRNAEGRTGLDTEAGETSVPTQVGTATDWATATAGTRHSLGVRTDGTLWAWGANHNGRTGLGIAGSSATLTPTQVGSDTGWAEASAGGEHSLAVRSDGTLWAWGWNAEGRTGLDTNIGDTLTPTQVGSDSDWAQPSAGETHSHALRADGTLWSWGTNVFAALGLGTQAKVTAPNQLSPWEWISVSAGADFSLGVRADGTLWAWGYNSSGRTGLGTASGFTMTPTQVGTATNWSSVSAGSSHSLATRTDGTLWAWGPNSNGETGLGTTVGNTLSPTQVGSDVSWVSAEAGFYHSLALRGDW